MPTLHPARTVAPCPPSLRRRLVQALALWRQRRALRHLDDHVLRDIGLTRAQAEAEARRRPWDAPDNWRR